MEGPLRHVFKDSKGGIYEVPESDLEEFKKAVPDAIPSKAFFDRAGHTYAVPENEIGEFAKAVPDAMEADSVRRPGFFKQLGSKFVAAPVQYIASQAQSPATTRAVAPLTTGTAVEGAAEFDRLMSGLKNYEKNVLPEGREADEADLRKATAQVRAVGPMGAFAAGKAWQAYNDRLAFEKYTREALIRSMEQNGGKPLSADATTWPIKPSDILEESQFAANIKKAQGAVDQIFAKQQAVAAKINDKLTPDGVKWADRFSDATKHNAVAKAVLDATDNWPQLAVAFLAKGANAVAPGLGSAAAYGVMSSGEASDFMQAATQIGIPASFAMPYAEKYGMLAGGVEYQEQALNIMSLGYGGMMAEKISQKSIEKLTKMLGSEVMAKIAAKIGGVALSAVGEGTEELIQGAVQFAYLSEMIQDYGKQKGLK
ncbi:MAG: hypothetical protein ACOX6N_05305, partial [Patescibacteria group bacterium]